MIEIEHCPFCKNHTTFSVILPYEEDPGHVKCLSCGAETPFDIWNCRPIEDALRARIAELETIVEKLELAGDKLTMNPSCSKIDELEHDWIEMVKWIEKYKETHNAPNN